MNEQDLFAAIGETPEDLLENSERKPQGRGGLYLVLAACLCLIVSIAIRLVLQPPLPENVVPEPLPGQKISMVKMDWLQHSGISAEERTSSMQMQGAYSYETQFGFLISIEARVLDVLPDVYTIAGSSTYAQRYHILRLEVLDTIHGSNMPAEIYYLLPEYLSTSLKQFDSLIMTVYQLGCENYLMLNTTRQWMETFDYVYIGTLGLEVERGAIVAYTNGKLDMSLWELDGWYSWGWTDNLTMSVKYPEYPAKRDRSIENVKKAILELVQTKKEQGFYHEGRTRNLVDTHAQFDWPDAQAVLEYVKPFDNGYFSVSHPGYEDQTVKFRRLINGFYTNEYIVVNLDQQTVQVNNQFTEADMARLPNLVKASIIARYTPAPNSRWSVGRYDYLGAQAEYQKQGDAIFGVVHIYWGYLDASIMWGEMWKDKAAVFDHSYVLIYPDGKMVNCKSSLDVDKLIKEYQSQ